MKTNMISRVVVLSAAVFGTVVVATSQPGVPSAQATRGGDGWPTHPMIPPRVDIKQLQEFKDAASLHLNDVLHNMNEGAKPKDGYIVAKTVMRDFFTETIYRIPSSALGTAGGGPNSNKLTPGQLAMLMYVFDQGIDNIARVPGSSATGTVSPTGITGNISPKDLGMSPEQLRASAMRYCETLHLAFWTQARQGLAQGGG